MRIIAATGNAHKLREIRQITDQFGFELVSQKDAGFGGVDPEENGATFEENSLIKAEAIGKLSGEICIADDSGICVDALGGAPGVHSARYAGEHGNDALNRQKMLKELEGVPFEERTARFVCVITMLYPDGRKHVCRGEVEGHIGFEERGENGFGYDSIFHPLGSERTFAEYEPEEKNAISHRANALRKLQAELAGENA